MEQVGIVDRLLHWNGKFQPEQNGKFLSEHNRKFRLEWYRIQNNAPFPWKLIEKNKPPRVTFLSQTLALGNILTLKNLRKLGVITDKRCYMYRKSGESVDHLLLYCEVGTFYGTWFWPLWDRLGYVVSHYESITCCKWQFGSHQCALLSRMTLSYLLSCLWSKKK